MGITGAFDNAQVSSMRASFPSGYERRATHQDRTPSGLINASASQSSVMGMTDNLTVQNDRASTAPLQYLPAQVSHASQHEAPNVTHPAFNTIPLYHQPASWSSDSYSSPESASSLGLPTQDPARLPSAQVGSTQSVPTVPLRGPVYTAGHLPLTAPVSQV